MDIVTIYECQISGGTDRLFIHLIKNWPTHFVDWADSAGKFHKNDQWQVYCHQNNSGNKLISDELNNHASILYYGQKKSLPSNKGRRLFYLASNFLRDYWFFKKEIKKNQPDVIFLLQGGYPGAFSTYAAVLAAKKVNPKVKIIMSIQNLPSMRDKKIFAKILDKFTNKNVDQFVFASKYTVEEYFKKTKLNPEKFKIVPEGVEANLENKVIHNGTGIINIGIIGSYERRKGRDVLFQAVKILIDKGITNFKILSYGQKEFGEFDYHLELVRKLGIENYVEWKDYEKDFDKLYGPLDIVVQPSIDSESMPLVPLDAAAYYKPVIASKLQGLQDEIIHGQTGYLFEIGDHEALVNYLEELILDQRRREYLGQNARKRYLENFTAKKMIKRYHDIFYA